MPNDISFSGVASGDLSTRQFYAVKLSGSSANAFEVSAISTGGRDNRPLGILQDDPNTSGTPANVMIVGVSKVALGGNVTQGDILSNDSFGRLIRFDISTGASNTTGGWIIGEALQSGNTTSIILALIHTPYPIGTTA